MKACEERKSQLVDLALGGPEPPRPSDLEDHLAGCPGCRAELETFRRRGRDLDAAVRDLLRGGGPAPDLADRVVRKAAVRKSVRPPWLRPAVLVPACAAVAAALLLILGPFTGPGDQSTQVETSTVAELTDWSAETDWLLDSVADSLLDPDEMLGDYLYSIDEEKNSKPGGTT